jgi:thiol-disulfide isomerase/thioredoxin
VFKRLTVLAVLAVAWSAAHASAEVLGIGDPAPKLQVKEFVKGDPVAKLEKGKIYVVEFWATWCGPCRASIPHLTELQKKHKDVTFIGVSVFENDQKAVVPFVKEMDDKMSYRVAIDDVPAGGKRDEGKMAKAWMEAAEQGGIPTAFIVDGEGKIAWIGHPMQMDNILGQVVAGKWDLKAARDEFKAAQVRNQKMRELAVEMQKAQQANDPQAMLAVIDKAIAGDPKLESRLCQQKFQILAKDAGTKEKALEYGKRLVETVLKDNSEALNNLAWTLVDPEQKEKPDAAMAKVAVMAAQRADELVKGKQPHIADTLALAYFVSGEAAKALQTQERAVELAKGTEWEKDPSLKERLEQYRKAAKK